MPLSYICVIANDKISFFMVEFYIFFNWIYSCEYVYIYTYYTHVYIICVCVCVCVCVSIIYPSLSIHLSVATGRFHFLAVVNNAAVNMGV